MFVLSYSVSVCDIRVHHGYNFRTLSAQCIRLYALCTYGSKIYNKKIEHGFSTAI